MARHSGRPAVVGRSGAERSWSVEWLSGRREARSEIDRFRCNVWQDRRSSVGGTRSPLSSTFRPSFLSRSYQRPEDGLGGDEAEGLVERQDGAAEWAGG